MNEEDNGGLGAAALFALGLGYLGMHFLFPGASPAAMVLSMLKRPAPGLLICRAAFQANPQLYFSILRTAGAAAAAAAFGAACA
ncbi:hypothetical protein BDA96_02G386900 [Sorghum bicolor]|uniref:Uncharacterized protein n=2 Tax=Sorghum bicolor TaxID=4558 RepID=A0A921RSI9_SORBI|nr:hypothetical protein BDA96_02G386900 [Sorghum bicolor]KXG36648.1 hypothetical protein SORBI_3002G369200 [Sorghum bicolor]